MAVLINAAVATLLFRRVGTGATAARGRARVYPGAAAGVPCTWLSWRAWWPLRTTRVFMGLFLFFMGFATAYRATRAR
jgi:hypothetical protein